MKGNNKFLKIGIIYTIGQLLTKAMSFVMIPIYTKELGVIGFGQLSIVDAVMNFISSFLIISIYSGYIRFYRDYEEEKRNKLRNTAITFALIMAIINIVLSITVGKYISKYIFDFENSYSIFILLIFRSLLAQFITLLMCDYNLNYNAQKTVLISFVQMIFDLIFVSYFVVWGNKGITGIYLGYICSSLIILVSLVVKQIKRIKVEFDKDMFKDMFKFSFGLIPCNLSATVLDLADRYFLSGYKGFTQTGIYSMGYKVGMLIDPVFISPFKSIFTTFKFQMWNEKDGKKRMNEMFINYHLLGCLIIILLTVGSELIILVLSNREYLGAVNLIPLILFSYFLYGENEFFSLGIQVRNKTYITSIIMLIGGSVNIILNMIFIPKFGMYGAAFATLLSYIVINKINIFVSKKYYEVKYDLKKSYFIDFVGIFICLLYIFTGKYITNIYIKMLIGFLYVIIYIVLMERNKILNINKIRNIIGKK